MLVGLQKIPVFTSILWQHFLPIIQILVPSYPISNMPGNGMITILEMSFKILTFIFRQYKPADIEPLVLRKEEVAKKEPQQPQQQQQPAKKRRVISKQQQQRKLSNPR